MTSDDAAGTSDDAAGTRSRTRVRRLPEKQITERVTLNAILDAGRVAHVATVATGDDAGQPYVLPVAYARDGDRVLLHGSTGSRLFRALGAGAPTCLTVTLLDRLVPLVGARLALSPTEFPLARLLEGGTWAAGREIARAQRADGGPPFRILSDGTVF